MRIYLVLLLIICMYHVCDSQNLTKSWNVTIYDDSFSPQHPNPTWTYYGLKTGADTLIGEKSYKKLYKSNDSLFSEVSIIGGIREDSSRIYLSKSKYSVDEVLLYDFNISPGDTLTVYRLLRINNFSIYPVIATVDSVNTISINGDIKKQLFIDYSCPGDLNNKEKDIWIEGIGSIKNGLLNESCFCLIGCYTKPFLTCYLENDGLIWKNPAFKTCYYDSNTILDIEEDIDPENFISISIIDKRIEIQSKHQVSSVRVINIQGQTIFFNNNIHSYFYEFFLNYQDKGLLIFIINHKYTLKRFY